MHVVSNMTRRMAERVARYFMAGGTRIVVGYDDDGKRSTSEAGPEDPRKKEERPASKIAREARPHVTRALRAWIGNGKSPPPPPAV